MSRSTNSLAVLLVAVALAGCGVRGLVAPQWGVQEGRLQPCTGLRGCVSSQAAEAVHHIEPFEYRSARIEARNDILTILRGYRDAQVVSVHPTYVRAEFTSREAVVQDGGTVYRGETIVDIAEFYFPADEPIVQVRSAPRRQMPDSGENRSRIEAVRARFADLQAQRN
jgi:uncharacterized protein (DUF1499 family)